MKLLAHMFRRFVQNGTLRVIDADGVLHVFAGGPGSQVTIRLHDKALYTKLFFKPELYGGEAYMDGTLTFEDGSSVEDLLTLFATNRLALGSYPLQSVLRRAAKAVRHIQQYNPASRARKNVAHHYDLSNDLYRLFLDQDMQYSCAYYRNETDTLEQAQENKKRHIASKLLLKPGQKVLDIGCGWGGLSLYLARQADVEVTGITLSTEQLDVARKRARDEGLDGRVRFELMDYRDVQGSFDRIVSVGMFEHVGVPHYPAFFDKIHALLPDDGVALLHSISHRSPPGATSPWLRKYIFPGGYSPAVSEVMAAIERKYLWVTDIEILRMHYAYTLQEWNRRFQANRDKVAAMYDERFCRMWEFYLIATQMVFRYGSEMVFQMQIAKKVDAVPFTRDYMIDVERADQTLPVSPQERPRRAAAERA